MNIKIKIICSSPSSNITANKACTCGLWVSSSSITPTPKAQYHLLGSIFSFRISPLVFLTSLFSWLFTCKLLNHAPTRFSSLLGKLIPDSLLNLELEKMSSLPRTPNPEPAVLLTATHPRFPALQGLHWHPPCSPVQKSGFSFLHGLTTQHIIHNLRHGWLDKAGPKQGGEMGPDVILYKENSSLSEDPSVHPAA